MRIKHCLDKDERFMPHSGKHVSTLCGMWFQENYKYDRKRYTANKEDVTCKRCLKIIEKDKL